MCILQIQYDVEVMMTVTVHDVNNPPLFVNLPQTIELYEVQLNNWT